MSKIAAAPESNGRDADYNWIVVPPARTNPRPPSWKQRNWDPLWEGMLKTGSKQGGFYGDWKPQLFTYDPVDIKPCASPFFSRDLTVCHSMWFWFRHVVWLGLGLAIALGFGQPKYFPDGRPACNGANHGASTINKNICHLEFALDEAKTEFRFLIPFILAGCVTGAVNMWNRRRSDYAALCGGARNLNINLSTIVPLRPELAETRATLHRWVMLAFELAMLKSRGMIDSDDGRGYLERAGLLLPTEWDALVDGDRHTTVFWWIQIQVRQLADDGVIAHPVWAVKVFDSITFMRAKANDMMSSLDRDQPYPYVALCGLLVQFNIVFMTVWHGFHWAIWNFATNYAVWKSPKIWVEIFVLFSWNLSYAALFDLTKMLYNPFGQRRIDVAHDAIGQGVRALARGLATAAPHIPATMSPGVTAAVGIGMPLPNLKSHRLATIAQDV